MRPEWQLQGEQSSHLAGLVAERVGVGRKFLAVRSQLAPVENFPERSGNHVFDKPTPKPTQTANRLNPTCPSTFAAACSDNPCRVSASVSKLNDEKVVNPPSTPTITKVLACTPHVRRSLASSPPSTPIRNDPATLMTKMPHGNRAPNTRA